MVMLMICLRLMPKAHNTVICQEGWNTVLMGCNKSLKSSKKKKRIVDLVSRIVYLFSRGV